MPSEEDGSITCWIDQLKAGDQAAAQPLWECYFQRLVRLARAKLPPALRAGADNDEEDAALSAFKSFCQGAAQGRFPRLDDRHDLWQLLVTITARKASDQIERARALKRGGGMLLDEAALDGPDPERRVGGLDQLPGPDPTPEFAAMVAEQYQHLLDLLGDRDAPVDRCLEARGLHSQGDRPEARPLRADGRIQARADPAAMGGGAMSQGYSALVQESPADRLEQILRVCEGFEVAWRAGAAPRIEDYLANAASADRPALLGELLGLELELRRKQGKRVDRGEYLARFPAEAGLVEAAFLGNSGHEGRTATGPNLGTVLDRPPGASDSELLDVVKGLMAADARADLERFFSPSPAIERVVIPAFPANLAPASRGGRPPGESSGGSWAATDHESSGDGSAAETFNHRWSRGDGETAGCIGEPEDVTGLDHRCPESPRAPMPSEPSPPDSPARGSDPGRLQVLGEVARGGMGVILRGHDTRLGRDLAIKVLSDSHEGNPTISHRFIEEAQITGQLQHPGIVPIYELGILADRRPYFAMKLVEGSTLAALLNERLDLAQDQVRFLAIFHQVAQTVAYAHSRGIVHRDLKPSNIMVGSFGEVLVMDWGLAKPLRDGGRATAATACEDSNRDRVVTIRSTSGDDLTEAGSVMGTPAYMAPEQARGDVECLDERCDVFALGSILCEILTGRPAYTGRSRLEIMRRAERGDLSEARTRLDGCGAYADLITLRMTAWPSVWMTGRDAGAISAWLSAYTESLQERIRRAELGARRRAGPRQEAGRTAAEAEAKALAERRARRLTVALAVSVLALTTLGIGVFAWSGRQRRALLERVDILIAKAEVQYHQALQDPAADPLAWQSVNAILDQAGELLHGTTDSGMSSRIASLRDRARVDAEKSDEARKQFDRLSELVEEIEDGDGLQFTYHPEEAIRLLTSAVMIRPRDSRAHNNLGLALAGNEEWDRAIAAYREAIRLKPDYASATETLLTRCWARANGTGRWPSTARLSASSPPSPFTMTIWAMH